jgi:hypothetical protein
MPLSRMMRSSPDVASIAFMLALAKAGNKKERDRVDPLFVKPTKNLKPI